MKMEFELQLATYSNILLVALCLTSTDWSHLACLRFAYSCFDDLAGDRLILFKPT